MVKPLSLHDGGPSRLFTPTLAQCDTIKEIVEKGEGIPYTMQVLNRFFGCQVTLLQHDVSEEAIEIGELSIDFLGGNRVIIERVVFTQQHRGTFTKLMKHIYSMVRGTSVKVLEVQSVLTGEMVAWCNKYGFHQVPSHCYNEDGCGGSYVCDAQDNPLLDIAY